MADVLEGNETGETSCEVVVKVGRYSRSLHYNDTGNGEKIKWMRSI